MTNPYLDRDHPLETIETERTVIIDPVTGAMMTIGARIDRTIADPVTGQERREILHVVTPSADGQALLFPYKQQLYRCGVCGAHPLVHATRCLKCRRWSCAPCTITIGDATACRACTQQPFWKRALAWLTDL